MSRSHPASQAERIERIERLTPVGALRHLFYGWQPRRRSVASGAHRSRRAERLLVALAAEDPEGVSRTAIVYLNRLSDFLFVASRWVNERGAGDVLWVPGQNR
jgi:cob(I)alamin adenosyltransferase